MSDQYATPRSVVSMLDAALVILVTLIVAGVLAGLFFLTVPSANLAIIASIVSGLVGAVIGGYAGFRWGASLTAKPAGASPAAAVAIAAAQPPAAPDAVA